MTDGIVNVLKPPGMTSHDVVSRIRRIYGVKKAGHSGTLDPDAADTHQQIQSIIVPRGFWVFVPTPETTAETCWKQNPFRIFPQQGWKKFYNSSGGKFYRFLPCIPR